VPSSFDLALETRRRTTCGAWSSPPNDCKRLLRGLCKSCKCMSQCGHLLFSKPSSRAIYRSSGITIQHATRCIHVIFFAKTPFDFWLSQMPWVTSLECCPPRPRARPTSRPCQELVEWNHASACGQHRGSVTADPVSQTNTLDPVIGISPAKCTMMPPKLPGAARLETGVTCVCA
jgi:hypothetical protein